MPAFKYRQKNSLIVFERGHKAHGYVQTADGFLLGQQARKPGVGVVLAEIVSKEKPLAYARGRILSLLRGYFPSPSNAAEYGSMAAVW